MIVDSELLKFKFEKFLNCVYRKNVWKYTSTTNFK